MLKDQCASLMPFGGDSKSKPKIIRYRKVTKARRSNILNEMKKDTDMALEVLKIKHKWIFNDTIKNCTRCSN